MSSGLLWTGTGGSGAEISGGGGISSGPGTDKLRDNFILGA